MLNILFAKEIFAFEILKKIALHWKIQLYSTCIKRLNIVESQG